MSDRAKRFEEPTAAAPLAQRSELATQAEVSVRDAGLGQARGVREPPGVNKLADILEIQKAAGNRTVMRMMAEQQRGTGHANGLRPPVQVELTNQYVQCRMEGLSEPSDEEIQSAAAEGIRTPATTLPYLDRIQTSFGRHPVGHVKAHLGVEAMQASRAMNALAFTSGDHVVFGGAPDLRTAAHEAAHVVQQRAGVQLVGGIGREWDFYERHADAVADSVVAERSAEKLLETFAESPTVGKSAGSPTGTSAGTSSYLPGNHEPYRGVFLSPVIQRMVQWKAENHKDEFLDKFVDNLNTVVQVSADVALDPDPLHGADGYINLWKDTAVILRAIQDNQIDEEDSDQIDEANAALSFAAARYGYAVESLACADNKKLSGALPDKCTHQLQASRGMTRPDIVVIHQTRGEIGWFDITSDKSVGHIDKKTGSGWKDKPYVAEITYPKLDQSKISASNSSVGERVARRNAMERRVKVWDDLLKRVRKNVTELWNREEGSSKTKVEKQALIRRIIGSLLEVDGLPPQATKSVLRALAWSVKDYGFDEGGTKSEGQAILRNHFGA